MGSLRNVALITGLLPIIAIHTTYVVSAMQGHVPWCFPYIDSCASISATGRHGASFYIFKGTIIPSAMLLILYWYLCGRWLVALGDRGKTVNALVIIGCIGAVFLIVYTVALGAAGEPLKIQRRVGIIVYFTFTYFSQLLLVWRSGKLIPAEPTRKWLLGLCITTLGLGLLTLVLDAAIDNYDDYEEAFEWVLALLIHSYFLVVWQTWRNTGFGVQYAVD